MRTRCVSYSCKPEITTDTRKGSHDRLLHEAVEDCSPLLLRDVGKSPRRNLSANELLTFLLEVEGELWTKGCLL